MKVKSSSVWIYTLIAAFGLSLAACGNSQKKREKAVQQRMAEQAMDTVTVIESETVIVIDSLKKLSKNGKVKRLTSPERIFGMDERLFGLAMSKSLKFLIGKLKF